MISKNQAKAKINTHSSALGKTLKTLLLKSSIGGPALALIYAASPAEAKEPLYQIIQRFQKEPESQQVDPSITEVSTFLNQENFPIYSKKEIDNPPSLEKEL